VRQFLYLLVGSSATYTVWGEARLAEPVRFALAALCVALTLAFALLRPYDRPLEEWLAAGLVYLASPRRSTWTLAEPTVSDWRPVGGGWHELTPSLSWAEDDTEWR
jgi:hypothetical protein